MKHPFFFLVVLCSLFACSSGNSSREVGSSLGMYSNEEEPEGVLLDLSEGEMVTRPGLVVRTAHAAHRLVPVFKLRKNPYNEKFYIGGNRFHRTYNQNAQDSTNIWHDHLVPGFEAMYGVDLLNVSHINLETKEKRTLFDRPFLVNTVYYPCIEQDTLNGDPIERDYYLVSVYDEDTNGDSLINRSDLRRFYHYNLEGEQVDRLIPANYSVQSSQYDQNNDIMVVFARLDENENGKRDLEEPVHVFWLDLKSIKAAERLY